MDVANNSQIHIYLGPSDDKSKQIYNIFSFLQKNKNHSEHSSLLLPLDVSVVHAFKKQTAH